MALSISEAEIMQSCKFFDHLLENEHMLQMFMNRSLDAIMMCCLAFSTTISNNPIVFNLILEHYRNQPQYIEGTIAEVYMREGVPRSDIIMFYTDIFVPNVRAPFTKMNVWSLLI
jgi:hypothetical protein